MSWRRNGFLSFTMFRLPQTILQTPLLCSHDKILFSACERITIALFLLQAFTWRAVAEIVSKFKLPVRLVDKHVPTGQKLTVTNNRKKKSWGQTSRRDICSIYLILSPWTSTFPTAPSTNRSMTSSDSLALQTLKFCILPIMVFLWHFWKPLRLNFLNY